MSLYEITGAILGVIGVWLMIRRNVWGWPVGIVQVALYAWVFFQTKLYSDAILQVFFFGLQIYGWWFWWRGGVRRDEPPITRLSSSARAGWMMTGVALTLIQGWAMANFTDAALPRWDAFILVFSLIAQWLQARKHLECWTGWMIVNAVAIGVYWSKDLRLTSGLYLVFFGMAVLGHLAWRRVNRVRRVAVFGPESTGKTLLAEKLAAHFGEPWVPEYARQFWDEHGGITLEDIPGIAQRQGEWEDAAAGQAKRLVFCDTESLTTVLWSDLLYRGCPPEVRIAAERRARRYDLYLLTNTDVPFEPDPQRVFPDEAGRTRCMTLWREALVFRHLRFVEIRGDWAQRERAAIAAVEKLLRR
ncbi:MAG: nicotinamide riboside transporter PnuC [Opitutaceae bacterium]